jgi:hypothetical protein
VNGRIIEATVDGVKHRIPEAWIVGFCRGSHGAVKDVPPCPHETAIRYWHEQHLLAQAAAAEK